MKKLWAGKVKEEVFPADGAGEMPSPEKMADLAPTAMAVPETAKPEPEVVFSARLTVAQVQRQGVRLNVGPSEGPVQMTEASLNFNRVLVPPDYEPKDGREYTLVITRVK